jgi:nucleoid-associated protein YgaU
LGDARRWREIADLNGIRDPRAITVGQVLRLP